MSIHETIALKRDCDVVEIPSGVKGHLKEGTKVAVTQALGGMFTVVTDRGYMVRVDGKDADALGKEPLPVEVVEETSDQPLEERVWDQLKTIYDPEIPVNIVELGLIYLCDVKAAEEDGNHKVHVKMTLTAPGCGMGAQLQMDAERKIGALPGIGEVLVDLVWDPPWDRSMMSEQAKLQLGML